MVVDENVLVVDEDVLHSVGECKHIPSIFCGWVTKYSPFPSIMEDLIVPLWCWVLILIMDILIRRSMILIFIFTQYLNLFNRCSLTQTRFPNLNWIFLHLRQPSMDPNVTHQILMLGNNIETNQLFTGPIIHFEHNFIDKDSFNGSGNNCQSIFYQMIRKMKLTSRTIIVFAQPNQTYHFQTITFAWPWRPTFMTFMTFS